MDRLKEKIVEFGSYLNDVTNVGLSNNEKDMYFILEKLVTEVQNSLPKVPCMDKCSGCCINSGLPRVTSIEWNLIHKHIINNMSEENKNIVLEKLNQLHVPQLDELIKEQNRISQSHTKIDINNPLPKPDFKSGYCPFLIENSCSIYEVRPAICRAYGFFSIRVSGHSQLFTCQMAADQIMELLREKGVEHWALPVWDKFADKLYQMNDDKPIATLPIWLMVNLDEKGNISMQLNRNPDFEKLLSSH